MECNAEFSKDKKHRLALSRIWDRSKPVLVFCMLNPSIAGLSVNDPTVMKCIGFAKRLGYGGIHVVNLFSVIATDPKDLYTAKVNQAADSDEWIKTLVNDADVILAWGAHGVRCRARAVEVTHMINAAANSVSHLGLTKDRHPRHPLMLPYLTPCVTIRGKRRAVSS